jgi:flavin reductase (DIM6/NTAB) family NADH-FMN oxidoreductase RutF
MKDVEYLEFMWPMRTFLVTCGEMGRQSNVVAVSFCMPVSKEPPMLACAITKKAYSSELIDARGEFVVNVPPATLRREIYLCGTHSGRTVDKFKEAGLIPKPARSVKAPIIGECLTFMECKEVKRFPAGDKNIFVGQVVEAYADEALVEGEREIEFAGGDYPRKIYGTRFP